MNQRRESWRWTPAQDIALYQRRRIDRAPFKQLAHEFGRSEPVVLKRFHEIERKLESSYTHVLEQHRREELALLEKLLTESQLPDCGEHG